MTANDASRSIAAGKWHGDVSWLIPRKPAAVNTKQEMGSQRKAPSNDDDPGPAAA
jgi:hypothetical protein